MVKNKTTKQIKDTTDIITSKPLSKKQPLVKQQLVKQSLIDIDKLEIKNLPEGVKVATMCSSCFLGTKLDLDNIEKYMNLHENDILTIKRNKDSIKTLIELKKLTKRALLNKKKAQGNNFYNSIKLIVRVKSGPT